MNRSNWRRVSRFRSRIRPVRFASATSKMSFARSTATVVASMSVSSWLRGVTHIRGNDAAKEPGGVHAITPGGWRTPSCQGGPLLIHGSLHPMRNGLPWRRAPVNRHWLFVAALLPLALASSTQAPRSDGAGPLRFAISFPAVRSATPIDGRVLLFVSDDGRTEPRNQTDQYRANTTRPIFGVDVDALAPGQDVVIDDRIVGWPLPSVRHLPPGEYWAQALVNRYETFRRSDGHTVKLPMDRGDGQKWASKPGNFFSQPVQMRP